MNFAEENPMYGIPFYEIRTKARSILEPVIKSSSLEEIDRLAAETEAQMDKLIESHEQDQAFFPHGIDGSTFHYFDAPDPPTDDVTNARIPAVNKRFYKQSVSFVNLPPLPIKNKALWFKKWKTDPPEIPI